MRGAIVAGVLTILPTTAAAGASSELARYYPAHAARHHIEGEVLLDCTVQADGSLQPCAVTSEQPQGENVGAAALKMSATFHMKPRTNNGQPVGGGRVTIPIHFRLTR